MSKDIILFVNAIRPATFGALQLYEEKTGRVFTPVVLVDKKIQTSIKERNGQKHEGKNLLVINADFDSPKSLMEALRPYYERIFAVTCQYENSMLELKKLVPYFPYLPMPSERSLDWSTEKKLMRDMLEVYDPSLVPGYMEVLDSSEETIARIENQLTYPMVVKPSGLEGSLLVSMVNNRNELSETLKNTFRDVQEAYNVWIKRQTPRLLVEEFMDGDMYSVDTYVGADGTCYPTPPVSVLTGRRVGFDDFFGYMQSVPCGLSEAEIKEASITATKACHAIGLRSVTAHVELMKLPDGWKVIELGSRIGGYRHDLYMLGFGINHIMNDILNRAGEVPEVFTKTINHVAAFNIYAHEEGILESIDGVEAVKKLDSFVSLKQAFFVGDQVLFAKHNGDRVFEIILSNKHKKQFDKDVEYMQNTLILKVKHPKIAKSLKA